MKREARREFLKKLAKGSVYIAPAILSMSAPVELVGRRVQTTQHGHMGHGGGGGMPPAMSTFPPPPP